MKKITFKINNDQKNYQLEIGREIILFSEIILNILN